MRSFCPPCRRCKAALSVNECDKTCPPRFSCNGVTLPITKPPPMIGCTWTGRKLVADTNFSMALLMPFLMARFSLVPQVACCTTSAAGSLRLIEYPCIDSSVDRSVADGCAMFFQTQTSCDFFRRPLMFDEFVLDESKQVGVVQFFVRTAFLAMCTILFMRHCKNI